MIGKNYCERQGFGNAGSAMSEWIFDLDAHCLVSGDVSVRLTPKAAAVLDCLMARSGEIVSRENLLETVWPGLHVTPDLVREYIHDLRTALGDDAQNPRFIKTVRGSGFQFLGGIRKAVPGIAQRLPARELRASLAILRPYVQQQAPDCAPLAEAVATDIINELGRYRDIAVVARVSSFSVDMQQDARAIARTLAADYLLESNFDILDGTVRARFQLVDGGSGQALWSDKTEHAAAVLNAARDDIVGSVVATLVGWHGALHMAQYKSVSVRGAEELTAFEHFIRGCDIDLMLDEPGLMRSITHFRRSLELDPRFARCWAMKSVMLRWAYDVVAEPSAELLAEAGEAIERACLFEPSDPIHLALAAVKWAGDGDLPRAAEATRRAAQSAWSDADACMAVATPLALILGDLDAAGKALERAHELNPALPGYHRIVETRIAFFTGDFERSVAASQRGFEHVSSIAFRALSQAMLGDAEAALATVGELDRRFPRFNLQAYADRFPIVHSTARNGFDSAVERLRRLLPPDRHFAVLGDIPSSE